MGDNTSSLNLKQIKYLLEEQSSSEEPERIQKCYDILFTMTRFFPPKYNTCKETVKCDTHSVKKGNL